MKNLLYSCFAIAIFMFISACGGGENTSETHENDENNVSVTDENTNNTLEEVDDNTTSENTETVSNGGDLKNLTIEEWERSADDGYEYFVFEDDGTFQTSVTPTDGEGFTRKGTYRLEGNIIHFNYEDMEEELTVKASINGSVLTLTYNAGTAEEVTLQYNVIVRGC